MERSERSILTGIGALRIIAWVWMLVVLVVQRHDLAGGWRSVLAWLLVAAAGAVTVWLAALRTVRPAALLSPVPVITELLVGLALMSLDGVVFAHGHIGTGQSSLASSWPLAGVMTAGVAYGVTAGLAAGLAMGVARACSVPLNSVAFGSLKSPVVVSILSTTVIYALGGAIAGYVTRLLRDADDQVAQARAREDVSRTLHDGVLQTLALVMRRSADPQLERLAREQEGELRAYLATYRTPALEEAPVSSRRTRRRDGVTRGELEGLLRSQAQRFERTYASQVDVVVASDVPEISRVRAEALAGAVGESLTNAGKHGNASKATIYVEPAQGGGVFCSVKDDGTGFDAAEVREGLGLTSSVRGRIAGVGGRVEIDGGAGRGAEVKMWL